MYVFRTTMGEAIGTPQAEKQQWVLPYGDMSDHGVLDFAVKHKFISSQEAKELHGYLAMRNRCAHFSTKRVVNLNQALGMADMLLDRVVEYMSGSASDSVGRRRSP